MHTIHDTYVISNSRAKNYTDDTYDISPINDAADSYNISNTRTNNDI